MIYYSIYSSLSLNLLIYFYRFYLLSRSNLFYFNKFYSFNRNNYSIFINFIFLVGVIILFLLKFNIFRISRS